ncbi:MAG: bifunctional hexulose-6-phosphate synthase/ribonuclease regulator [Euryarchaeota archaeon]|nr:bifunctional hexulose-6-phosphate synthase/ribonuclease regulator [Euryarchaeota archaeon]
MVGATEYPVLHVALDLLNLHRAVQIAQEAAEGGADWIEAGTPLIKSEGMEAVRALRRTLPGKRIVADMKTLDVGAFEVEMAAKAGAAVAIVMGISDDDTIRESVRAGKKYGCEVMVDLLGCADKPRRARELQALGVDYLCVHVGIDEQMTGGTPFETVRRVSEATALPVAAAGGINSETAAEAVRSGASIVIVGGAVTKAPNVAGSTRQIRKAMLARKVIRSGLYKKYGTAGVLEALLKVSSSNVSDALHRKGAMGELHCIIPRGCRVAGPALTVRTADGDWAKPLEAIDLAGKGDVIVIDAGEGRAAVWGELASWSCKVKGIAAVVIDGGVRDVQDILEVGFPAFATHIVPNAGEPKGMGEIGAEIVCAGQAVRTGDWVVGDESGVSVIPKERLAEVANRALDVLEKENRLREEIRRGSTLSKVMELYKWEKVR